MLGEEAGAGDQRLAAVWKARIVSDREEGDRAEMNALETRMSVEGEVEREVAALVDAEARNGSYGEAFP